ncbi:diguanylate cyclase domain-containing protein [Hydrogenophaga sp.]|uniref:diguanylate cyclase domain-containing protein n=1 Tax=Hydrogenophaga sp. TaxID=1904254 RepID=UPI002730552B|nr:diguanylate cyclase [Hydrogenophaga sp.]MDP2017216.1 diguanylate cyclase [Hydrogenophaga sp.]
MPVSEIAVWSAMLGGLLTLSAVALGDVLASRSTGSVRNLLFVLIAGASCVVITGLPEVFFPELPERLLMVLKASLGPLAGAMALYFLGTWLGGVREDALVHNLTALGGTVLLLVALALVAVSSQVDPMDFHALLVLAAFVNLVPVLLGLVAVIRAAKLGDPLARWMGVGMVCLAAATVGLYARGLNVPGLGQGTWLATAVFTLAYFLIASVLGLVRNRYNRELARLSRLEKGAEPATGLPTGAALLAEVEHAFWRTARRGGVCTVVCLHVSNLYELTEAPGQGTEHQILTTLAARVRRAAGFRCVVGLYHPRCFVVVISTDKLNNVALEALTRLRSTVALPMSVTDAKHTYQPFTPQLGMGVVTLEPDGSSPMEVINQAERRALAEVGEASDSRPLSQHDIDTAPGALL